MTTQHESTPYAWLVNGNNIFPALTAAIDAAKKTVRLEVYIFGHHELGRSFLATLVKASQRGVRVQVLVDAFCSPGLPSNFWDPLREAGGEMRWFNPDLVRRLSFRDHRKMLVCDEHVAFVGGFNISAEYDGDGVNKGWFDIGLKLETPLAVQLAAAFDEMFNHADAPQRKFRRASHSSAKRDVITDEGRLLLAGPVLGRNPFTRALRKDLKHAGNVQIICPYFLPTARILRELRRIAHRHGTVQLMLPGKSDVLLSQFAAQSLYRRMLKAGVEIYHYQPQILHAKLVVVDNHVYIGSSNLDPRSLHINYELMLRIENKKTVSEARALFADNLQFCKRIEPGEWRKSRTWWNRLKSRWSYFILTKIDPVIARWGPG